MKKYVKIADDGVTVEAVLTSRVLPDFDAIEVDSKVSDSTYFNSYMVNGELVERPTSPVLEKSGDTFQIKNCPDGTEVQIVDAVGDEVLADFATTVAEPNVEFQLTDIGTYQISITPPFPYMPQFSKVEG